MATTAGTARGAAAYLKSSTFELSDDRGGRNIEERTSVGQAWSSVIDELLRFRTLDDDWDGEGTDAPDPAMVDNAIHLAQALKLEGISPPDRVHVSVNATIYFEWRTSRDYTEFEVVSPLDAELRRVDRLSNTTLVRYFSRDV